MLLLLPTPPFVTERAAAAASRSTFVSSSPIGYGEKYLDDERRTHKARLYQ